MQTPERDLPYNPSQSSLNANLYLDSYPSESTPRTMTGYYPPSVEEEGYDAPNRMDYSSAGTVHDEHDRDAEEREQHPDDTSGSFSVKTEQQAGPTSDLLDDQYRSIIKQIQGLRELGIESRDLPLPKICAVGDQSAGKSSVIEAMSGIKVPRKDGCCTRCPLEINLQRSEPGSPWKCKVSLVKKFMYCPDQSKLSGLGPWKENHHEPAFPFFETTDKNEVTAALDRAQIAILNPGCDPAQYIPLRRLDTALRVEFSPNIVRVDISAPDVENLSFYDLPGVISVTEKPEERYLVKLVQNLVLQYIRDKTCIILLALSMTEDPANSNAFALVRKVAAAQKRTRGVFTKPDALNRDTLPLHWVEMLNGRKYQLGLGYGVVMNGNDPTISHYEARREEEKFFKTHDPWKSNLRSHRDSFGTPNLQKSLSTLLNDQIRAYLPKLIEKIEAKIKETEEELRLLPEPPNQHEIREIMRKMFDLNTGLTAQFEGGSAEHTFQKRHRIRSQQFEKSLQLTRPTLAKWAEKEYVIRRKVQKYISGDTRARSPRRPPGVINLDSDDEGLAAADMAQAPQGRARTYSAAFSESPAPQTPQRGNKRLKNNGGEPSTLYLLARQFTLDEIREINRDAQGAGLPTPHAAKAVETMSKLSLKHWRQLMDQFLNDTDNLLKEMVLSEFDKVLGKYRETKLYKQGKRAILQSLAKAMDRHREFATRAHNIEVSKPFTMNESLLKQGKNVALENLEEIRKQLRKSLHIDIDEMKNGRVITQGEERAKALRKLMEIGPDEFANEVETMAIVRAYYDCAASRFTDNICQALQAELFADCQKQLPMELDEELKLRSNSEEKLRELLEGDPRVQERRRQLLEDKERFEEARKRLCGYRGDRSSPEVKMDDDVDEDGV